MPFSQEISEQVEAESDLRKRHQGQCRPKKGNIAAGILWKTPLLRGKISELSRFGYKLRRNNEHMVQIAAISEGDVKCQQVPEVVLNNCILCREITESFMESSGFQIFLL